MKNVTLTITINRPIEAVFAFATNPDKTPTWLDSVVVEKTNEWPPRLGTIYKNQNRQGEWSEYEVAAFEPNKTFTFSKKNSPYYVQYNFASKGQNATELEYREWADKGELAAPFTMDILEKFKRVMEEATDRDHAARPNLRRRHAQ